MSRYRRAHIPGGCFFFTVVTHDRVPLFRDESAVARLRNALRRVTAKRPFTIDAIVVLPDHIHALWHLPEGDGDFSERWRLIKHYFTANIRAANPALCATPIWQRRFWEHAIRDESDWRNHLDYIHYNPVHHGYVRSPADWPYGSFHRAVEAGWYAPDWGETRPHDIAGMAPE
ncbi:MAG: transposase [Gammaproteobacteria bacterium]|nr:transposase [Gammaproteobacteria bacterium]